MDWAHPRIIPAYLFKSFVILFSGGLNNKFLAKDITQLGTITISTTWKGR